jgi:hypothetical protein
LPILPLEAQPTRNTGLALRRVLLSGERVSAELMRLQQGELISMPRAEFEKRVEQARRTLKEPSSTPRLIQASYSAVLSGNTLIDGVGIWTVLHPGTAPEFLRLGDLNLAISRIKTMEGKDAVLAEPDSEKPALLVHKGGKQTFLFDWTLRGIAGNAGLQFELLLPACPVATLDLKLPMDHYLMVSPTEAMISGPFDSEDPNLRRWRLHFTGRTHVDLVVRKKSGPRNRPLILSQIQSRLRLDPGRCRADFDVQLEVLNEVVETLEFHLDRELEPFEVTIRNLEVKAWKIQELPISKGSQQPRQRLLTIYLHEPFQGSLAGLRIRCLAPAEADRPWKSPGLWLRNAFYTSEDLTITLHPDVRLDDWSAGAGRLVNVSAEQDGTYVFQIENTDVPSPSRPGGILRYRGVEYQLEQFTWWQVKPQGFILMADLHYSVQRGELFQLPLRMPGNDWQVEAVNADPPGPLRQSYVAGNLLWIDLEKPVRHGQPVTLHVRMKKARPPSSGLEGHVVDFPEFVPADPCTHTGGLGISVDPFWQPVIHKAASASAAPPDGPWRSNPPLFFFPYRNAPVSGQLRLVPFPQRFGARCHGDVILTAGQGFIQVALDLEPLTGSVREFDLSCSAPVGSWEWDNAVVASVRRLGWREAMPHLVLLGARSPWDVAAGAPLLPAGQFWRVTLRQPLQKRQSLVLKASFGPHALQQSRAWNVPVVSILGTAWQEGKLSVRTAEAEIVTTRHQGLREESANGPDGRRSTAQDAWKTFRYAPSRGFPSLTVWTRKRDVVAHAHELFDQVELTTVVVPNRGTLHFFHCHFWNWQKRHLPLMLPPGTRILSTRVDGHLLDHIDREDVPDQGAQVAVPVPGDGQSHRLEVTYAMDRPGWSCWLWQIIDVPVPRLPMPVLNVRRTWRLPPGLVPLQQSAYQCLDNPGRNEGGHPGWTNARLAWRAADPVLSALGVALSGTELLEQRQLLAGADAAIRSKIGAGSDLATVLEQLAFDQLKGKATLVIDASALAEADLLPTTHLSSFDAARENTPIWEHFGLVYVPTLSAPLLTTRQKLRSWRESHGSASLAAAVVEPVAEAAAYGHDSSGRFRIVADWLQFFSTQGQSSGWRPDDERTRAFSGWVEWEPLAVYPGSDQLVLVNRITIEIAGGLLALCVLALAWWLGRHRSWSWRFRLLLIWLGVSGLIYLWLPASIRRAGLWVFLAALGWGLIWYLRDLLRRSMVRQEQSSLEKKARSAVAIPAIVLALLPGLSLTTALAAGEEDVVFLLPGPKEAPDRQVVLISPKLLERLNALRQRATPTGAVLVSSSYEGDVHGTVADLKAKFDCFSFDDKTKLIIPLGDVDLKEGVFLDGVPVYPTALPAPDTGYVFPVSGKGLHRLNLAFRVRVSATSDIQELRFSVPRLAQSRLELRFPPTLQDAQAVNGLGRQLLVRGPTEHILKAELGRDKTMQVRWRQADITAAAAEVEVREWYLWDLRPPFPTLNGLLQYSVAKGRLSRLELDLPAHIEVRSIDLGPSSALGAGPRLKSWRVQEHKGQRILQVDLYNPVGGQVQLKLSLALRTALRPGNVLLQLPYPLLRDARNILEGYLAYRLEGLEARDNPQGLGVNGIAPDAFIKSWQATENRPPPPPTRAFRFRRGSAKGALGLTLYLPVAQVTEELSWKVHPTFADWNALLRLRDENEGLMMAELAVPPDLIVSNVVGQHVQQWTRSSDRIQIWLDQPQKEASVKLAGWVRLVRSPDLKNPGRFVLPDIHVANLRRTAASVVHVRPAAGLRLTTLQTRNLVRTPEHESAGALVFAIEKMAEAKYAAEFQVSVLPAQPEVRALTTAEFNQDEFRFAAHINIHATSGDLSNITIFLRHWPNGDVQMEAPSLIQQSMRRLGNGDREWHLTLPAGVNQQFFLRLVGRCVPPDPTRILMPDVSVRQAERQERWVAISGAALTAQNLRGLVPIRDNWPSLPGWEQEIDRIRRAGAAWSVEDENWELLLASTPAQEDTFSVLLTELEAAQGNDGRWLHQARFDLFIKTSTDLHLVLPDGAEVAFAALDTQPILPRRTEPGHWWLSLLSPPGTHVLRVRWVYPEDRETPETPNLTPVIIAGRDNQPALLQILAPAGFEIHAPDPLPAAAAALIRAEGQLRLLELLAEQARTGQPQLEPQIALAQQRLTWWSRMAERLAARDRQSTMHPAFDDLRKRNDDVIRRYGLEKTRAVADQQSSSVLPSDEDSSLSLHEQGRPILFSIRGASIPSVHLLPNRTLQVRATLLASELLLAVLIALAVLSGFPRVVSLLYVFWPEQILLLAFVGWWCFGPSLIGVILFLTGATSRLMAVIGWLQGMIHRHEATANHAGSTASS